jgi:predicted O-methyltransferase YrrM
MNIGFEFIKYSLNAKGRQGIHSPFVYNLMDKVLSMPISSAIKSQQKELFASLKSDNTSIEFEEFGAGSKKLGKQRTVKQIVSTNSTQKKYGDLLYRIMYAYQPMNVLELGTSLGTGTLHMHWGNPMAKIITIEGCKATYTIAKETIAKQRLNDQIDIKNCTFQHYFKEPNKEFFDLVFIDGHHDGNSLIEYLRILEKNTHNDTIFILDDIRWNNDMFSAWKKISSDKQYHLTIDFFKMGLLIRQETKQKEHFVLRKSV